MKKIMITTVLLLMMLSMTVSAGTYSRRSYSPDRCCAAGCNGRKYNKSSYCSEHKCVIHDCKNKRGSDGIYCSTHHNQYYHIMKNHYSGKSSSGSRYGRSGSKSSSSRSGSSKSKRSTFDPDDHDIESYEELIDKLAANPMIHQIYGTSGKSHIHAIGVVPNSETLGSYANYLFRSTRGVRELNWQILVTTYKDTERGVDYEIRYQKHEHMEAGSESSGQEQTRK